MLQATQMNDNRLAYDLRELAAMLGCSVELLRKEIGRAKLRPSRLGKRLVISARRSLSIPRSGSGRVNDGRRRRARATRQKSRAAQKLEL